MHVSIHIKSQRQTYKLAPAQSYTLVSTRGECKVVYFHSTYSVIHLTIPIIGR